MQTAESRAFRLRAIDGGLSDIEILARSPERYEDSLHALASLLTGAQSGISFRRETQDRENAILMGPARILLGDAGDDQCGRMARIRSFDPILRGRARGLDLTLVSDAGSRRIPGEIASTVNSNAEMLPDIHSIDLACRYARHFGRRRLTVLSGSSVDSQNSSLAALEERFPELEFGFSSVDDYLGRLVEGRIRQDMVVVSRMFASNLRSVAIALTQTLSLVAEARIAGGRLCFGFSGDSTLSGLLLGAVELLVCLGRREPAQRLADAWARTLEHGIHTGEIETVRPYSKQLDERSFAAAVLDRLGERPQTLNMPLGQWGVDQHAGDLSAGNQRGAAGASSRRLRLVSSQV